MSDMLQKFTDVLHGDRMRVIWSYE